MQVHPNLYDIASMKFSGTSWQEVARCMWRSFRVYISGKLRLFTLSNSRENILEIICRFTGGISLNGETPHDCVMCVTQCPCRAYNDRLFPLLETGEEGPSTRLDRAA